MPVAWRLHVLEERLKRECDASFTVEAVDLHDLSRADQSVALDALIETRGGFPVVLVEGTVACVDDIDTDAIVSCVAAILGADRLTDFGS